MFTVSASGFGRFRRAGVFDVVVQGSEARVRYGLEVRRSALQWGIELAVRSR
jgi:hypothetical protein